MPSLLYYTSFKLTKKPIILAHLRTKILITLYGTFDKNGFASEK